MSDHAHVTDIESIELFRSKLVLFLEKAGRILDEASEEVKRTRVWLQSEQKLHLQQTMRRKKKDLDLLQQELFTARLSKLTNTKTGRKQLLQKKQREIREVENTMRAVAAWTRNFDSRVEVPARKVEKLRQLFETEMVNALRTLKESAATLRAYSASAGRTGTGKPVPQGSSGSAGGTTGSGREGGSP